MMEAVNGQPVLRFKKLQDSAIIPEYKSTGASGFDFCCLRREEVYPRDTVVIKIGLAVEIPSDCEMQLRGRSGLAAKSGYIVKTGTIDSDYRGELGVIICNISDSKLVFREGDRIAQGIIAPVRRCRIIEADELGDTARGDGGLGSTGVSN